jgi:hypothetical protein
VEVRGAEYDRLKERDELRNPPPELREPASAVPANKSSAEAIAISFFIFSHPFFPSGIFPQIYCTSGDIHFPMECRR